jgi:hypothetical protein
MKTLWCKNQENPSNRISHAWAPLSEEECFFYIFWGDYFFFFCTIYSALLHLPPLRFHCADGCWDQTQDRCNWCISSQTL